MSRPSILLKSYFVTGICDDHRSVVQLHVDDRNGEISFTGNAIACSFCNPSITSGLVIPDLTASTRGRQRPPNKPSAEIPERYRQRSNLPSIRVRKAPVATRSSKPVMTYEQRECPACKQQRSFAKAVDDENSKCKLCRYFDSLHETNTKHNAFHDSCYRCATNDDRSVDPEYEQALELEDDDDNVDDVPLTQSIRRNYTGWLRWGRD